MDDNQDDASVVLGFVLLAGANALVFFIIGFLLGLYIG